MPSKLDELRRDVIRAQLTSPGIVIRGVGVGATSEQGQGSISGVVVIVSGSRWVDSRGAGTTVSNNKRARTCHGRWRTWARGRATARSASSVSRARTASCRCRWRIQVRSERFRSWTSSPSANPATYFTAGTSGSICDGMGDDSGTGNNSKVRI